MLASMYDDWSKLSSWLGGNGEFMFECEWFEWFEWE
jgi:hypothetical protein